MDGYGNGRNPEIQKPGWLRAWCGNSHVLDLLSFLSSLKIGGGFSPFIAAHLQLWGPPNLLSKRRDSSVGIALGYGLDGRGSRVRFPAGAGNFFFTTAVSRLALRPPPSSYPVGTRGSFPGGKAAREWTDHSPPSSADVKNAWSCTSTLPYVFTAWCLVKHRMRLHVLCT
jgi:hypothetical protein